MEELEEWNLISAVSSVSGSGQYVTEKKARFKKNLTIAPTWNTCWPVWSFVVVVIITSQCVAPLGVVGGKLVVTSSAARVVEVTTAAPRTQGVVVSQSQIRFRRWLRSIETVDNWGKISSEMEAVLQNNNRLNWLSGVLAGWKIRMEGTGEYPSKCPYHSTTYVLRCEKSDFEWSSRVQGGRESLLQVRSYPQRR